MIWKIVTLVGAGLLAWTALRRLLDGPAATATARRDPGGPVADLERCSGCGAWRAPGAACACDMPPTP